MTTFKMNWKRASTDSVHRGQLNCVMVMTATGMAAVGITMAEIVTITMDTMMLTAEDASLVMIVLTEEAVDSVDVAS